MNLLVKECADEVVTFPTLSGMVHPGLTSIHLGKTSHSMEKEATWQLAPGCSKAGPRSGSLAPWPHLYLTCSKAPEGRGQSYTSVKYKGTCTQVLYRHL